MKATSMRILSLFCCLLASVAAADPVPAKARFDDVGNAAPYRAKDGVVEVDISEYAGYAGLIAANGGLDPSPDSWFARTCGFQVRLRLTESESFRAVNEGQVAATVTTADVLPLLGAKMDAAVPLLISYSRGADGLIVRSDIKAVNDLKGRTVAVRQFIETEFFLRYLAMEADIPVRVLAKPDAQPDAAAINLVFAAEGFAAGDLFASDLSGGANRLAGCVTWSPKTTEIVSGSAGAARQLVTNRNLLVIADVLLVNKAFAAASPQVVQGLVHGALEGNRRLRSEPAQHLGIVAKAFAWDDATARSMLGQVHLANRAENLAFFNGTMDAAGSFAFIAQSAALVYADYGIDGGDPQRLVDLRPLQALAASFPDDRVDIQPQSAAGAQVEPETVLKRDIRFQFEANSNSLDMADRANNDQLDRIAQWLKTSPGSQVQLVGHVEPTKKAELEAQLGKMQAAIAARKLGQARAEEIRRVLTEKRGVAADRIRSATRGWEQPLPEVKDPGLNRRVEVQWKIRE